MGGGLCRVRARLAPRDCARGRTIKTIKMRVPAFVISFSAYPTKPRLPLSSRCRARGARGRPRGGSREGVTTCSSEKRRSGSARGGRRGGLSRGSRSTAAHVERPERVRHARFLGRIAMRSSAQGACPRKVWHAAHLRGEWPISHLGKRASAMRDLRIRPPEEV